MKKALTLLSAALTIVALAACGSDGGTSAEDEGSVIASGGKGFDLDKPHPGSAVYGSPPLEFEADPGGDLAYTSDEVTARERNMTIEFTNPQSTPHNVAIEAANGGKVVTDTVSNSFDAVTVTLNSREKFIFYCTVPGHREAGMEGVLEIDRSSF